MQKEAFPRDRTGWWRWRGVGGIGVEMELGKYSFGMGDRFARQGVAQLRAIFQAVDDGYDVVPVWNKSHREHSTIGSVPADVRAEADAAVAELGWTGSYFVDADHVNLKTVGLFMVSSDFFTIDVAEAIGKSASEDEVSEFVGRHPELVAEHALPGTDAVAVVSEGDLRACASKYLAAVKAARRVYSSIRNAKGEGTFVVEVSMDESEEPQTPAELLVILAALADEGIPLATLAPKFSGRFNKGVDYVGNVATFATEFDAAAAVLELAVEMFGFPEGLKLSVHSGSDKFSIYPAVKEVLERRGVGLHVKTAGTTWLEELIGLAEAGGDALEIVKSIYFKSFDKLEELCEPYATVVDINPANLPDKNEVGGWSGDRFIAALRHVPSDGRFNPDLRQLLHVGYKIAAGMGKEYMDSLEKHADEIAKHVEVNIIDRHIRKIFPKKKN
jgi:hypothetical protein